ncbi:MAG TPA: tetratricopeptide repeat protein, partial [Chloroflexia bacterium]|nr:tetratricopeptide repeat protein [Chloroflexia bacterium]
LGLHEGAGPPGVALLRPYLRHRQLLLVLDNWEHLGPAEPVLADLLAGAPGLGLLVTSQVPLRLAGARTLPLPALALPPRHPLPPLAELQDYPAIALFLQGAHVAGAAWQLAPENAGLIAAICTRLEGVPLALELAAARSRLCPPAAILAGLDAPLDFLTEESAERPARHQAVRHALAWSYALLHHADQVLFAGLGVFAGGAPLAAVATLGPPLLAAAGLPPRGAREAIQRGLERLLAHHLLARAEVPPAAPRFTLLATVRAYAREQLQALDLLSLAEHHHAAYYLALAEQLAGAGTGTPDGLDRLEGELENCHAALGWSLTDNQDRATAGRLALALGGFWETRGYWQEGRHWLGRVLAEAAALPDALVAQLRYWAGRLAYLQGDYPAAAPLLQASLAAGQAQADGPLAARALTALGWMAYCQEDYRRARDLYEQGLAGCRASDPRAAASVLNSLGAIALLLGDRAAEPLLQESLALREAAGDRQGVARSLDALGLAAQSRADYAQAGQYLRDSLALARTLGDKLGMSLVLNNLGWVCVATGDLAAAQLYLAEALGLAREVGSRWSTTLALCYLGWVAVQQGTPAAAAALLDESLALTEAQGMPQAGVLCHLGLAQVALATAEPRQAARQLAAAAALRQRLGTTLTPYERQMVARLEQAIGPP